MKPWFASTLVAGMLLTSNGQVFAHHPFAATYSTDQSVIIEGELVQVLFRNGSLAVGRWRCLMAAVFPGAAVGAAAGCAETVCRTARTPL
jgi:hypothetical protein